MSELLTSIDIGLIYGVVAIGIYLTFRVIDFPDLTCDGSFVLGAAVCAILLQKGCGLPIAIAISCLAGALAGLATSFLYIFCGVSDLLSGILVAFMLYPINLKVMGNVPNIALSIDSSSTMMLASFVVAIWLFLWWFLKTDFGLALRVIGQNKKIGPVYGLNMPFYTAVALCLSNSLIALSGALLTHYQGFADISQGLGTLVVGLASVMIGEKIMPSILTCIIGSIMYRLIISFALHTEWLGLETSDLNLITGFIVIAVMWMPYRRRKYAQTQ